MSMAAVKTLHLLHAVMLWRTPSSCSISDLEQLGVNIASQIFMLIVHSLC